MLLVVHYRKVTHTVTGTPLFKYRYNESLLYIFFFSINFFMECGIRFPQQNSTKNTSAVLFSFDFLLTSILQSRKCVYSFLWKPETRNKMAVVGKMTTNFVYKIFIIRYLVAFFTRSDYISSTNWLLFSLTEGKNDSLDCKDCRPLI